MKVAASIAETAARSDLERFIESSSQQPLEAIDCPIFRPR